MNLFGKWLLGAGALVSLVACGESGTDDPVVASQLSVPEPVASVNGTSATIRWVAVENAHHYAWEWQSESDGAIETGNVFTGQAVFSLSENTIYRFRVQSVALPGSAYADSEWSPYVTVSSNMLAAPSPSLVAESLTDTSATLEWTAVESASGYKYELTAAGAVVASGTTQTARVAFENRLAEGTAYRFRAMAISGIETKNDSPWSDYVAFTTRQHTQLAAPVVTVGERTAVSAELSWEGVEGAVKYAYKLYDNANLTGSALKEEETTDSKVVLGGLKELTYYYFVVRAIADANDLYAEDSEYSQTVEFRTKSAASVALDLGLPAHEQDGVIRAFPGAEGAGMFTTGGRGGKVYHVTSLEDTNTQGTLRYAVSQSGARTIVFDVAGTIALKSALKIANGNVTIAGQTAPGDGICLKGYGLEVNADNVIVRYLRIRPGDENGNDGLDALGGRYMQNVIIDHCSLSWSTDECVSFYVNRNMTMQYCLAYESLRNGKHNKGTHGYGGIWGGAPASFHHNILAHHDSRNPRLDGPEQYGDGPTPGATATSKGINRGDRRIDFRNNVVYNFCNYPAYGGVDMTVNFVGNCYKWGPASINGAGPNAAGAVQNGKARLYFCSCDTYYDGNGVNNTSAKCVMGNPKIYCDNSNLLDTSVRNASEGAAVSADNKKGFIAGSTSGAGGSCPFDPVWATAAYGISVDGAACSVTTHSAADAFDVLIRYCGASLRQDAADARVLADVKNGTGASGKAGETTSTGLPRSWNGIIDSQVDVGGYPTLSATDEELARVKDTDGDGIPDYYEDLFDLNSNDASDGAAKTLDPQGLYTNLEIYLHYLVKDITLKQVEAGTYTTLK